MTQTRIEEQVVPGKRLSRHINHDPRSRSYALTAKVPTLVSTVHERVAPVLDQGNVGSCVGNSVAGALGTTPLFRLSGWPAMDEAEALKFYSAAETIDGNGPCPPNDKGSSGLSGAAAVQAGSPAVTSTASPSPTPSPPGSLARYQWLKDGSPRRGLCAPTRSHPRRGGWCRGRHRPHPHGDGLQRR